MQYFQTSFPEKALGRLKPSFMWSFNGMEERKFVQNSPGHMTKMAAIPKYGKNMNNSSSLDDFENLYAALNTGVLPNLFKWCPWVDLDLFYGKVKFGPLCFCMGKSSNNGFFRNYCRIWYKSQFMHLTKQKLYEYQRSRSFIDLGPNHSDSISL